jgi:hypothetical protein
MTVSQWTDSKANAELKGQKLPGTWLRILIYMVIMVIMIYITAIRLLSLTLILLVLAVSNVHAQRQALMPYADPSQAQLPMYQYSYYLQPWKSYMDTCPGSQLLNCIGINFNVNSIYAAATARTLAQCGFKEARMEIGWGNYQYNNPMQIGATQLPGITTALQALKKNGIRPLIVLNANSSAPCPSKNFVTNLIAAAKAGDTTIQLSDVSGIIPQYTGFAGQAYQTAFPLVTSVNSATGICTLSAPLTLALPAGPLNLTVLKYHPLGTGGQANAYTQETIQGWTTYVQQTCALVQSIFGNAFDLEVWNELTFASQFLDDNNYYSAAQTTTGALSYSNHGFTRSGVEILEPIAVDIATAQYPGVRVIDGFSNQRPWDAGSSMWPGEHGFSRHYYTALDTINPLNGWKGVSNSSTPIANLATIAPMNVLGQYDGTPSNPTSPHSVTPGTYFIPSFTMSCPESMCMSTNYLYMLRDFQPSPSLFASRDLNGNYTAYHWRGSQNLVGNTAQVWESETNCSRILWMSAIQSQSGLAWTDQKLIDLNHFIGAKALLRLFTFYSNKGLETACVFAARQNEFDLSVIPEAFFSSLDQTGGTYSSDAWNKQGGQLQTVKRLTGFFNTYTGPPSTFTVQPLTVTALSEAAPRIEFSGDGTPAHPDRYNIDDFGVFPFQLNQNTYAVAYYVVTRNLVQNWGVVADVLNVSNYCMPDETFNVTISGLANGLTAQVSCYDPLNDRHPAVPVVTRSQNSVQVKVLSSDYPRFLLITTH